MDFKLTSHLDEVLGAEEQAKRRALEIIGMNAEKYAKALCPVGTPESTGWTDKDGVRHPNKGYRGGTLRNSISHQVVDSEEVHVGTNVEYAPFVELGTSKMAAKPYLGPSITDHIGEYESIVESELKKG